MATDTAKIMMIWVLFSTPPEQVKNLNIDEVWSLATDIQEFAVQEEFLDKKEMTYVLASKEDVENDMGLLISRFNELKGCPKTSEIPPEIYFLEVKEVSDLLAHNRSFKYFLEQKRGLLIGHAESELIDLVIKENDKCYEFWDAVKDVHSNYYYVTVRRRALKKVKDIMKENGGEILPIMPHWRFMDITDSNRLEVKK
jgi:hypothetical protein